MSNEGGGRISNEDGGRTYKDNELKRVETETKRAMSTKKMKRKCRERKHNCWASN